MPLMPSVLYALADSMDCLSAPMLEANGKCTIAGFRGRWLKQAAGNLYEQKLLILENLCSRQG